MEKKVEAPHNPSVHHVQGVPLVQQLFADRKYQIPGISRASGAVQGKIHEDA